MFFRKIITKRNGKEYVYLKLIENFRSGDKIRQRVVANLGNIDNLTPDKVKSLIDGLIQIFQNVYKEKKNNLSQIIIPADLGIVNKIDQLIYRLREEKILNNEIGNYSIDILLKVLLLRLFFCNDDQISIVDVAPNFIKLPNNQRLLGMEFYRLISILGESFNSYLKVLRKNMNLVEETNSYFYLINSSFYGQSCELTELNYPLTTKTYSKPVHISIETNQQGQPLNISVFNDVITNLSEVTNVMLVVSGKESQARQLFSNKYYLKEVELDSEILETITIEKNQVDSTTLGAGVTYWDGEQGGLRYIIIRPDKETLAEKVIEVRLYETEKSLNELQKLVNTGKIKREKNILSKIETILKKHQCSLYFNSYYDHNQGKLWLSRKSDIINQAKRLAGMTVLETNTNYPLEQIIGCYNYLRGLEKYFKEIKDILGIPPIYPYVEYHYNQMILLGHYLLYYTVYYLNHL